jgi:secretion/DNA translocation related TadE-like protein
VRARADRGSASLLAVGLIGVLVLVAVALGTVSAIVHAHRRAQAAADLAALAGAAAQADGRDGCQVAAQMAVANGGALTGCHPEGADLRVLVTVEGPDVLGTTATLTGEARAGP